MTSLTYKRGQEVLRCEPFAHILNKQNIQEYCDYCLAFNCDGKYKQCSRCRIVQYCGRSCQKMAWKEYHRQECMYLRQNSWTNISEDYVRLIFRLMIKLSKGDGIVQSKLPNGSFRGFEDLMSHKARIENDKLRMKEFQQLFEDLHTFFKDASCQNMMPSRSKVLEIYGKTVINSLTIYNVLQDQIGSGVFLAASVFDHSCVPNATWHCIGTTLVVRALEDISVFDDVKISYVPRLYERTSERQELLNSMYYFLCNCSLCQDRDSDKCKSSINCSTCGFCVPLTSENCPNCGLKIDISRLEKYAQTQKIIQKFVLNPPDDISLIEYILKETLKIMHCYDKDLMNFMKLAFQKFKTNEKYEMCYVLMKPIISNIQKHFPPFYDTLGLTFVSAAEVCLKLRRFKEAKDFIKSAEDIFKVSHGDDHPILTNGCAKIRHEIVATKSIKSK